MRRPTNQLQFENLSKFIKLPFVSIQLQRAHLPPVFVPYYESSAMSHTINPKDQKMFSMNFNFINTINLYWLQLYSIFVFYSKMLINQSVIIFFYFLHQVEAMQQKCKLRVVQTQAIFFEINVGKRWIRHGTTLNLNDHLE